MNSRILALLSGAVAGLILFSLDLWAFWPAKKEMSMWALYGGASVLGILGAVAISWLVWRVDTA